MEKCWICCQAFAATRGLAEDKNLVKLQEKLGEDSKIPNHRKICRPFGENIGMILGESAQFVVLMQDSLALELGLNIYGAALSSHIHSDGYKKSISGPGAGNYFSVGKTLKDIETVFGEDVLRERSAFLAHGTGTPLNRITESHIMSTFAKEFGIENLPVSSVKSKLGHTMGAAGVGAQALKVFGPEKEMLIAVMLTLAILYFSEIIPKTMGAMYWRILGVPAAHMIIWLGQTWFEGVALHFRLADTVSLHSPMLCTYLCTYLCNYLCTYLCN